MHAGSLVFNGSFVTLMAAWFLGCTFVLQEKFDAVEFIETVDREQRHARDDGAVADRRGDQRAELLRPSKLAVARDAVFGRRAVASRAQGANAARFCRLRSTSCTG